MGGFGNIPNFMQQMYADKMRQMYAPHAYSTSMGNAGMTTMPYNEAPIGRSQGFSGVPLTGISGNIPMQLNHPIMEAMRRRRIMERNAALRSGHPMYRQNLLDLKNISGELDEPTSMQRQYERAAPSALGEMLRRKNIQLMNQDARDYMGETNLDMMPDIGQGDLKY